MSSQNQDPRMRAGWVDWQRLQSGHISDGFLQLFIFILGDHAFLQKRVPLAHAVDPCIQTEV